MITRREMLAGTTAAIGALALLNVTGTQAAVAPHAVPLSKAKVSFTVNGQPHDLEMDTRTTLLDTLREHLHVTGTKRVVTTGSVARARYWSITSASIPACRWPFSIRATPLRPSRA